MRVYLPFMVNKIGVASIVLLSPSAKICPKQYLAEWLFGYFASARIPIPQ